jgi:mono/diheme cytochrome c family protein
VQYRSPAVLLVSLVLGAATPHSTRADSTKGSQLAQQWCASCHVTSGSPPAMFSKDLPAFARSLAPEPTSCAPSHRIRMARCQICR